MVLPVLFPRHSVLGEQPQSFDLGITLAFDQSPLHHSQASSRAGRRLSQWRAKSTAAEGRTSGIEFGKHLAQQAGRGAGCSTGVPFPSNRARICSNNMHFMPAGNFTSAPITCRLSPGGKAETYLASTAISDFSRPLLLAVIRMVPARPSLVRMMSMALP